MIKKSDLLQHIEQMPEQIQLETLIDRLIFIEKLNKRISIADQGETITNEQLDHEIEKW